MMEDDFPFYIARLIQNSIPEHGHEFVELVFVVRGRGKHLFEGTAYEVRAGDVFIINPGETHAYATEGEAMEIVNCLFMPSFIPDALLKELELTAAIDYFYVQPFLTHEYRFNHRLNLHGQDAESVRTLLDGMIRETNARGVGYKTIIRLQMIELLILLSRYYHDTASGKSVISVRQIDREMTARRIYGYLERNYDKKITLESLAALFNVSERQLNRLMRLHYGKSVIDSLHEIRIGRAKYLLVESDEKIITIATIVGYEDPSFFSQLFHRHVGCSPGQYRLATGAKGGVGR